MEPEDLTKKQAQLDELIDWVQVESVKHNTSNQIVSNISLSIFLMYFAHLYQRVLLLWNLLSRCFNVI